MHAHRSVIAVALLASVVQADPAITRYPIAGARVTRLAVADATHVYAGALGPGLYASSDAGATWTEVILPDAGTHRPTDVLATSGGTVLVCEDTPSAVIVRGDASGLVTALSAPDLRCFALASGTAAGTYYAGVVDRSTSPATGHLFESTDDGRTWTQLAPSIEGSAITEIVQLPTGRLVLATRQVSPDGTFGPGAIATSDDNGMTLQDAGVTGAPLGLAYNGSDTLMAVVAGATSTSLLTSSSGQTWGNAQAVPAIAQASQSRHRVAYHPDAFAILADASPQTLLLTTGGKPAYTVDAATDHLHVAAGVPAIVADVALGAGGTVLAADAGAGSRGVYAATSSSATAGGGFASQPVRRAFVVGGQHFALAASNLYTSDGTTSHVVLAHATTATLDVAAPTHAIAAMPNAMFSIDDVTTAPADDDGQHAAWTALGVPPGSLDDAIPALLANGDDQFAGVAEITTDPSIGSAQYLAYSLDRGSSFQAESDLVVTGGVKSIAFDPSNLMTMYAGIGDVLAGGDLDDTVTPGGLYKSTDGGLTWNAPSPDPTLAVSYPRAIVVDPMNGQRVWLLAQRVHTNADHGFDLVLASTDGGSAWQDLSPGHALDGLAYDPASGQLFVGSGSSVLAEPAGSGSADWKPFAALPADVAGLDLGSDAAILASTTNGLYEIAIPAPLPPDGPLGDVTTPKSPGGCCDAGRDHPPWLAVLAAWFLMRRRGTNACRRA